MFQQIEQALQTFQSCFKRKAAYKWFVIIIIGLIVRPDHLGVTSIIRGLSLEPGYYETMLHFFRSRAWDSGKLRAAWYRYLLKEAPVYKVCGRTVMAGDGVKQSKEAFFMPQALEKLNHIFFMKKSPLAA